MREGWTYKDFESCLRKVQKAKQVQTSEYYKGSKYPIISQEEKLISGYCDDESMLICIEKPVVIFGDHTRILKFIDFNFVVGADGVKILDTIEDLDAKFLYYYLKWYNVPSMGYSRHYKLLKEIQIPLPPKSQQEAIVSELDEINNLLSLKRQELERYDKLAQSLFYEMFGDPIDNEKGWEVKKLGEIGTLERGAGISKKDFVKQGHPCIHYGQLHTVLGPTTKKHITCIPENLLSKCKIAHPGDLVLAITSEDVEGSCKSTAWLGNYDIIVGSDAAILHHEQNGTFLSYYTMTKAFFNEKAKYAKGFKVTHISTKEIEQITIYLPPLPLQQLFAERIEGIEAQKVQVKAAIEKLERLLAARMQYWFD